MAAERERVVWRLDRLGRNLRHLILLLDELVNADGSSPETTDLRGPLFVVVLVH
jgi:DNA invertase Pin-like site-specific DNA recombinase